MNILKRLSRVWKLALCLLGLAALTAVPTGTMAIQTRVGGQAMPASTTTLGFTAITGQIILTITARTTAAFTAFAAGVFTILITTADLDTREEDLEVTEL